MTTTPKNRHAAEIARYETDTLVSIHRLYDEDRRLRRRYNIPPRSSLNAFRCELRRHPIPTWRTPGGRLLWHLGAYLDLFVPTYENRGHTCARRSRSSVCRSYMEATPAILADPNWQPRGAAAKAARVQYHRLNNMTQSMKILPYWDSANRRLLFPVDQIRELAPWRPWHYLCRHCTPEQRLAIRRTRQKKPMFPFGVLAGFLYHVPELAHL